MILTYLNRTRLLNWQFDPTRLKRDDWKWFMVNILPCADIPDRFNYTVVYVNETLKLKYEEMFLAFRPDQIFKAVEDNLTSVMNYDRNLENN